MKPKFSVGDRVRVYGRNMEEVGLYSARPTYGRVAFIFSSEENPGFMDVRYDYGGLGCVHEKQCRRLKTKVKTTREKMDEWDGGAIPYGGMRSDKPEPKQSTENRAGINGLVCPEGYEEKVKYLGIEGGLGFIPRLGEVVSNNFLAVLHDPDVTGVIPITVWVKKETK